MTRCSVVYLIKEEKFVENYIVYAIEKLRAYSTDKMIVISSGEVKAQIMSLCERSVSCWLDMELLTEDKIKEVLRTSDKVLFSNDSYYGPLFNMDAIITKMRGSEFWSITDLNNNIFDSALCGLSAAGISKLHFSKSSGFFCESDLHPDIFAHLSETCSSLDDVFRYRSFEIITMGVPFLKTDVFDKNDLDNTAGYQLQKSLSYINEKTEYDVGIIYENILKRYNLLYLHQLLHWNFVISNENKEYKTNKSISVVVCLYYEKSLKKNLEYLMNIPRMFDVYLVLKQRKLVSKIEEFIKKNCLNWKMIIAKQNRGRDLSALLIEAKDCFENYEYCCFLHDKQTTGGVGNSIIGDDFNDMLFDNLIGGENYVYGIIDLFEKNNKLGLLAPPEVCHGTYFPFLGRAWSNNYENTKMLEKKLGLDARIEKEYPPYILGTAFWCRSKTLKKLFDYGWKYEDFPEEPLDMDGTLNHAIERIIMYVVQDAGYYAGVVCNNRFAEVYMTNLRTMLDSALRVCHKNSFFTCFSELHSEKGRELLDFCHGGEYIYIYGAGGNASRVADFLTLNNIEFKGYIVSDGYRQKKLLDAHKVFEISEIKKDSGCKSGINIIVSVGEKYREAILKNLKDMEFVSIFCI